MNERLDLTIELVAENIIHYFDLTVRLVEPAFTNVGSLKEQTFVTIVSLIVHLLKLTKRIFTGNTGYK